MYQVFPKKDTKPEKILQKIVKQLGIKFKKHIPLDGTEPIIDYHILGQNKEEIDKK